MSAQVMRRDRPNFASGDIQTATDEEIRAAYAGFISYFGTYTVNEEEKSVAHNFDGSLFPKLDWAIPRAVLRPGWRYAVAANSTD